MQMGYRHCILAVPDGPVALGIQEEKDKGFKYVYIVCCKPTLKTRGYFGYHILSIKPTFLYRLSRVDVNKPIFQ